jgi:hypothetical protein
MPTTDGIWRVEWIRGAIRRWPVAEALIASIGFCLALAIWLAARRLSGALIEPLPLPLLVATAAIAAAWAWSMRSIGSRILSPGPLRLLATWTVWALAIAAVWFAPLARDSKPSSIAGELRSPDNAADYSQGDVLQQLTRVRLAEGREAVQGVLVAEFAAGQDLATLYVGFCPPFERLPHVEAEMTDGPAANIKIVQVLHNGAQLDVSLGSVATETTIVSVEFMASEHYVATNRHENLRNRSGHQRYLVCSSRYHSCLLAGFTGVDRLDLDWHRSTTPQPLYFLGHSSSVGFMDSIAASRRH